MALSPVQMHDCVDVSDISREPTRVDSSRVDSANKSSVLDGIRRVGIRARSALLAVLAGAVMVGYAENVEAKPPAHSGHAGVHAVHHGKHHPKKGGAKKPGSKPKHVKKTPHGKKQHGVQKTPHGIKKTPQKHSGKALNKPNKLQDVKGKDKAPTLGGGKKLFPTFLQADQKQLTALAGQYTPEAVQFALRVAENGMRIALSPKKQEGIAKARAAVVAQYSSRIKIPKYFGYMDDVREIRQIVAVKYYLDRIMKERGTAWGARLSPEFVFAAAGNEGRLLDVSGTTDPWYAVDGFWALGLDQFGADFKDIVTMGILPKSFEKQFTSYKTHNEKTGAVSARFHNKGAALRAFVSEMVYRQKLFLMRLQKNGISLDSLSESDRARVLEFFTYIYYNAGPAVGHGITDGLKTADDVLKYYLRSKTNPGVINLNSAPANAYVVCAGAMFLREAGAVDPHPAKGAYWWTSDPTPTADAMKKK